VLEVHIICNITCCAVAQKRVLKTAWVPCGNMKTWTPHSSETSHDITMKHCKLDYVGETNIISKFSWKPHARGRPTHTWNIHFLQLFFLPSWIIWTSYPACNITSLSRKQCIPEKNYYGTLLGSHGRSFRIGHENVRAAPPVWGLTMTSYPVGN